MVGIELVAFCCIRSVVSLSLALPLAPPLTSVPRVAQQVQRVTLANHKGNMEQPPPGARTFYKSVAVVHDGGHAHAAHYTPRFVSIYDGRTVYEVDRVTSPQDGCWVSPDVLACVQHATALPRESVLLAAPRAILRVIGWGPPPLDGTASRHRHNDSTKLCVAHVLPTAVLPYTASGQPNALPEHHALLSDGLRYLSSNRPSTAQPARRPQVLQMTGGQAMRMLGGGGEQAWRMQAMTVTLQEDVLFAEERLRALRNMRLEEVPAEQQPAWMRRALSRHAAPAATSTTIRR